MTCCRVCKQDKPLSQSLSKIPKKSAESKKQSEPPKVFHLHPQKVTPSPAKPKVSKVAEKLSYQSTTDAKFFETLLPKSSEDPPKDIQDWKCGA